MDSSDSLGTLSILDEHLLRLILNKTPPESLLFLASSSTPLFGQVLESGRAKKLTLDLGRVELDAKWGEWLQRASGLHLQLGGCSFATVEDAAETMALLLPAPTDSLPRPNRGISALTVHLDVSTA